MSLWRARALGLVLGVLDIVGVQVRNREQVEVREKVEARETEEEDKTRKQQTDKGKKLTRRGSWTGVRSWLPPTVAVDLVTACSGASA